MDYSSVNEIFSAGTTNMQILRNNSKQDDGVDIISGVSWFTYNNKQVSSIYVGGNSFIGFGVNAEHLKVNRRNGALYSLYREEGTFQKNLKFLKIRWQGYSHDSYTSSYYRLTYDIILWETGDISLHMVNIPSSYNTGTYNLTENSVYNYTVSTSNRDISFKKTSSGFEVKNGIISFNKYLIKSNSNYYTINNNELSIINENPITSSTFLNFGFSKLPEFNLINTLSDPEIIYWTEASDGAAPNLIFKGTPLLSCIYSNVQEIPINKKIEKINIAGSDDIKISISFDNENTWKYYNNNNNWTTANSIDEGMSISLISAISEKIWELVTTSSNFKIRLFLPSINSWVAQDIYINYI